MDFDNIFFVIGVYSIGVIVAIVGAYYGWTTWSNDGWIWTVVSIACWILALAGVVWCIVWSLMIGLTHSN